MSSSTSRKKFPLVPYGCIYIDASWSDVLAAIPFSMEPENHRSLIEYKLDQLWNHAHATPSPILPCLSVRTAFDLYLSIKRYPRGSEMVFCAINIPDMARIVRHHGIKLVAVDVDLETMTPKVEHVKSLITPKTVAIFVAHLYGRWINLEDIMAVAKEHHLDVLEDCAESFCGLQDHGHPAADITFFSFGLIKTNTAFGGAIAVVRDPSLLSQMRTLYRSYPIRGRATYLKKLLKYSMLMTVLNSPFLVKHGMQLASALGINHRDIIVNHVRGFPKDFFDNIRMRPSIALLCMLYRRLKNFDPNSFSLGNVKCDIVSRRLPPGMQGVGLKAEKINHWLFPIVVDNPERVMKELNARGIDAYKGATQLSLIESDVAIPRNLANPSEKVQGTPDQSLGSTEDTTSCDEDGGVGESRDTAGYGSKLSKELFQDERPKYVSIHSKEAAGQSNSHLRDLPAQSQSSDTEATETAQHMSLRLPDSEKQSQICEARECITGVSTRLQCAQVPNSGTLGAASTAGSEGLSSLMHNQLKNQQVSSDSSVQSQLKCSLIDLHPHYSDVSDHCEHPSSNFETSLKHRNSSDNRSSTRGSNYLSGTHSDDSNKSCSDPGSVPTQKKSRLLPSVANQLSGGGIHGGAGQAGEFPKKTSGDSPRGTLSLNSPSRTSGDSPKRILGNSLAKLSGKYPDEARYLMDHVVYLPVHKKVSFHYLEQICVVLEEVASMLAKEKQVMAQSKL
ncbi:uncharacterized protein LOC121412388 [Lytechinus variegatus]|uniref:uncharacterized protein LOC121412388 n=1 Tax=Lytechinus variegatus TaxID=7654 RepID=UPI001BB20173|nr:uncharacterized protein LOC121412388 [Lytechinus variegatus]